jgi:hypothetical protein
MNTIRAMAEDDARNSFLRIEFSSIFDAGPISVLFPLGSQAWETDCLLESRSKGWQDF